MTCSLCHEASTDYLKLYYLLICPLCEEKLLKLKPETSDYQYLVYKLNECRKRHNQMSTL
ncbi:hypothetical protein GCM10012290_24950 [Halolactibacillus alkaliphilus]|uniref:Protein CsfB n=1 Tax=Halolactibacillus alkaliphilus TaxID=442899 RepID=A0A511X4P2_9BACI|nr:sigma factor G inhibitor Gin [Halolactibacillus alkaliphilus]GEN57920.1 hypothetical protein HAL01_23840 [Halolactibacillus alkaliphilus]GGN75820.1 hypothetical protein GCM10012290_24950 [Halolactibacillus alkaliphilus]SFP07761.1 Inhibitor of sigma-G Gin [Halolactibacillus alkaliphilus]